MTAINIVRKKMLLHKRFLRTLVLCPSIVRFNWAKEWSMHSRLGPRTLVLDGTGLKRCKQMVDAGYDKIIITNYESMRNNMLFEHLLAFKPEVIIYDESHRLKNHRSKTFGQCYELAQLALYRYILTGTPILRDASDLFAQFRVLDLGETFGNKFYSFRNRYFYDKNRGMPAQKYFPNYVPKKDAADKLGLKIKSISMRVKKKDCLDLPPFVRQTIEVPLSKEQKKVYDDLKKACIAYLEDGSFVATPLAITKTLRLLQIPTGFVKVNNSLGDEEEKLFSKNPRAEALYELLQDITTQAKVIVWACWRNNYDTIRAVCKKLGLEYAECHGDIAAKEKQASVDRFSNEDSCRVFIGNPASAGIGINLVSASYSIVFSRNYSLGDDQQAEARNYRGGSEIHDKITRIDLVAPGTFDETVCQSLANKKNLAKEILDRPNDLLALLKER